VITDPSFVLFCALKLLGGTRIIAQLGKTLRIYRSGLVFTWDLIIDQRSEFQSVQCFELISHSKVGFHRGLDCSKSTLQGILRHPLVSETKNGTLDLIS
jgi:hypothetical protein